jgi:hypothetical protein
MIPSLIFLCILVGCAQESDKRFDSPEATFHTYRQALEEGDLDLLWSCYSQSYHDQQVRATWRRQWRETAAEKGKALRRREINREQIINEQIAYLLFDASTLENQRQSPFFYFIHEKEGWKITTHLDSTFHRELEAAIERGEFKLPDQL